uniref:Fringe-like glycosyltransferase domain-containing protein n=1 Tax=viral metagenome TaxID=1070528 RepID=A0A6C0DA14_9ZZZZ
MENRDLEFTDIGKTPLVYKEDFPRIKICYIVLTCERYIPTRVKWQKETCFRNTNLNDCYFLSCKMGDGSIYGWNTADDYPSCIDKYIKFFRNMNLDYDWYMFIDDDTFVFPNRVEQFLARLDPSIPAYVGNAWSHIHDLRFMSGGAGFFLTKSAYTMVRQFVECDKNTAMRSPEAPMNGDTTMGVWIREINRKNNYAIKLLSDWHYLNIDNSTNIKKIMTAATFHYVNKYELFKLYDKYLETVNITDILLKQITPLPNKENTIIFSYDTTLALRHCYYKLSLSKLEEDNNDFFFIVKSAKNGNPAGVSFQSTNYPEYYIAPKESGIFISKDSTADEQSWIIEDNMTLRSLSARWNGMYLGVNKDNSVSLSSEKKGFTIITFTTNLPHN